jgi:putative FmdB family regulatory protein
MPIYEYHCPDCEANFEKLVPLSRTHEQPPCPKCSGGRTQKRLSTFAAIRSSGNGYDSGSSAGSSGGKCAGCSGGSCATC